MSRTILFIGGTKFIGATLVDKFLEAGDNVWVFSRSAPKQKAVTYVAGDRNDPKSIRHWKEILSNQQFDCIYDMCCYEPQQAESLYSIIKEHTKRLVFFSSAAVYEKTNFFPLHEQSSPLGEHFSYGNYGTNKAAIEKIYTDNCRSDDIQLSIFRPHYILGAGDYFKRHHYFFSRLENDQEIQLPGNGQALIQFAYAGDVVNLFLKVPFVQKGQLEVVNIASDTLISLRGVAELFAQKLQITPNIKPINYEAHGLREDSFYDELFPFPNVNLVLDIQHAKEKYNFKPTEPSTYLNELYGDWLKARATYEQLPNKF